MVILAQVGGLDIMNDTKKYLADKLDKNEVVYGKEQALHHIEELRQSEYEGKKHYENAIFEMRIVTTVTTTIEI